MKTWIVETFFDAYDRGVVVLKAPTRESAVEMAKVRAMAMWHETGNVYMVPEEGEFIWDTLHGASPTEEREDDD